MNNDQEIEQEFTEKMEGEGFGGMSLLPQAIAVLHRFQMGRRAEDLDLALKIGQEAVEQSSPGSLERARSFNILGIGFRERYNRTGNLADLEQAIRSLRKAIEQAPPGLIDKPDYFGRLAFGLREFSDRTGDLSDLEQMIQAFRQAGEETPLDSPKHAIYLNNQVMGLQKHYERTRNLDDLEQAIRVLEEELQHIPPDMPSRPNLLYNLARDLQEHFTRTGNVADLEQVILISEQIIGNSSLDSHVRFLCLNLLSIGLNERYGITRDLTDLERATQILEQLLEQAPPGSTDWLGYLNNLGLISQRRYNRTGNPSDLERAIRIGEQVLKSAKPDSEEQLGFLANLGDALGKRYNQTGDLSDLDRAIQLHEQVVQQTSPVSPLVARSLSRAGQGLTDRYRHTGNSADLERAIQLLERAVELTHTGSPDRPEYLNELGIGLAERYSNIGNLNDLEQAIVLWERALEETPQGSSEIPNYLNSLGNGLRDRYDRSESQTDLERAIQAYEQAVQLTPPNSPGLAIWLSSLGNGLCVRYSSYGDSSDLERAIQAYEQAVQLTPPNSPEWSIRLNGLAIGLSRRYEHTGKATDLEQAIHLWEQAVQYTPSDSPTIPVLQHNLGNGLRDRYAHTGDLAYKARAITAYEYACRSGLNLKLDVTLEAGRAWGIWALERKDWAEAVKAYTYSLQASEQLFRVQLLRSAKEAWLRAARDLHACAAYALTQAGDLRGALEIAERGRARLLTQVLERDRADLARLEQEMPEVFSQYHFAAQRLLALETLDIGTRDVLPAVQSLTNSIRQARADLNEAVDAIREVPGYETFLAFPTVEMIKKAIDSTPLVYIVTTPIGGLALIAHPSHRNRAGEKALEPSSSVSELAVTPLWLDKLTEKALLEIMQGRDGPLAQDGYLGAYIHWRANPYDNTSRANWFTTLEETTRILWDVLMGPLTETLTSSEISTAILIPQGLLGLLPLHAAWKEDFAEPTGHLYAMDRVTFSYIPNALTLGTARTFAAYTTPDTLLAVEEPSPVMANHLSYSAYEVEVAARHFATVTILHGREASRSALLTALSTGSPPPVWHFSCHGTANFTEPLDSGLLLANNDWLTVRDLLALRLPGVRLAILSACETHIPGVDLPDESINLPTGLMQAGVSGVIASLWSVNELSTMLLLARFYDLWREEGLAPVEALRQAQLWVRDTTNREKADYFKGLLPEFTSNKMPGSVGDELYKVLMVRQPNQSDFSHPFHWAAFGFTGFYSIEVEDA